MQEKILKIFLKKEFFHIGVMYLKQKKSEENEFFKYIENGINYDLFKKYFDFEAPIQLTKKLFEINYKKKNDDFVEEIKSRWSKLKDETEEMFENGKKIEQPDKISKIVEEILKFNKEKQTGKGLQILTANQMLSR